MEQYRFFILIGLDEFVSSFDSNSIVVYFGHHGDIGARFADLVVPVVSFVEKDGLYINNF